MKKSSIQISNRLLQELRKLKKKEDVSSYETLIWLLIKDYSTRHVYRKLLKDLEDEEK